jgi:molybdopterin molybdotransferase
MQHNIDYQTARQILMDQVRPIATLERVPLFQAVGRILAEDVFAIGDVPPFDRSPYDGYAFRGEDSQGASREHPVTLRILEEVPAGSMWSQEVTPGTATKILTGAPVPPGANAITKYEDTEFDPEHVTLFAPSQPGDNIVPKGEDVVKGQLLAEKGTPIDGALLGTLAAQGVVEPLCYAVPTVGILTTGSELVEAGETLTGGKIVNTNQYTFFAALQQSGCNPVVCGAPGDDPDAIAQAMDEALRRCDMVITTGGVSVGDYDFTPEAMERAGAEVLIRTVKLKPGGASAYGTRAGKLICGLSGNPASAMTNFYAVVLPALRKLAGHGTPELTELTVILADDFKKKSPKTRLIRGKLDLSQGSAVMHVDRGQGNGVLHSLIGCNLLAEIPAGSPKLPAGTQLNAYLIP